MQEIFNKILEAEKQAELILAEARKEAADLRAAADAQTAAAIQEARAAAQALLQTSLAEARAETERTGREQVQKAEAEAATFLESRQESLRGLVDRVVELLQTPETLKG
jgi:vacuolar-type H+-ATPase subunit H